jgi:hypothetical protein
LPTASSTAGCARSSARTPRVMRTVVDLLAFAAYGWLDANPNEAVKVALTYDGFNREAGGER